MKILIIDNYEPAQQYSMLSYARLLQQIYQDTGHQVTVLHPPVVFGKFVKDVHCGLGKWLSYIDRFVVFRFTLRRALLKVDFVHIADHANAVYVPWLRGKPHLVTCHDLLAIRGARGEIGGYYVKWTGRLFQKWILSGLKKARHTMCVSEQTKKEMLEVSGLSEQRTSVVPNALNYDYRPMEPEEWRTYLKKHGVPASCEYVLHVGGNNWYKNRRGVVRIFTALHEHPDYRGHHLVLAGKPLSPELLSLVKECGLERRIHAVVDADNETLRALYSGASFLLFPSLAEGFGWPIAEAMACGCPVVTNGKPPMTEVGGDAALYLEDVPDSDACADRIVNDLGPLELRRQGGFRQAARFRPEVMREGLLGALERALGEGA